MRLDLDQLAAAHAGHPPVLHGVTLRLDAGEIGALMGPSGSGKSTLLRVVAGLHRPAAGRVLGDDAVLSDAARVVPPARRGVGLVFQDLALLPHRTVAGNVAYGLFRQPRAAAAERVHGLLELVGLAALAGRYPHQLSGGQQQRVALARALAPRPRLLLLDEPFASLDASLRADLCQEVRGWLKRERVTALAVTHDQAEAFALADRVGVLHAGRLAQWDTPEALYHRPASPFVAGFVGEGVLFPGRHEAGGRVRLPGLGTVASVATGVALPLGPVTVLLRPDDLAPDPGLPPVATVAGRVFRGAGMLYRLRLDDTGDGPAALPDVLAHAPATPDARSAPALGERVGLRWSGRPVVAFAGFGEGAGEGPGVSPGAGRSRSARPPA